MTGGLSATPTETRHASSVAVDGRGILICGASGSGKSALALELIARGAALVSDDITALSLDESGWPIVSGTGRMTGVIEARGVGLLRVPTVSRAPLHLVIDMDRIEAERLPPTREIELLGQPLTCLHRVDSAHFAASILALAKGGRVA